MPTCHIYTHFQYGIGHYVRSRRIAEALAATPNWRVLLLISGVKPGLPAAPGVQEHWLQGEVRPGAGDASATPTADPQAMARARLPVIAALLEESPPDVFITEYFPFGYDRLALTLLPILDLLPASCLVMCSCRDFPVSDRESPYSYERQRLDNTLSRRYDRVLVHAEREYSSFADGAVFDVRSFPTPISFTGYIMGERVLPEPAGGAGSGILVTWGGGRDGPETVYPILETALRGYRSERITVVAGPFGQKQPAAANEEWLGAVTNVPERMAKARLVVAMAGYNTVVELLASGAPGLLVPRPTSYEQRERAKAAARQSASIRWAAPGMPARELEQAVSELLVAPRNLLHFSGLANTVKAICSG